MNIMNRLLHPLLLATLYVSGAFTTALWAADDSIRVEVAEVQQSIVQVTLQNGVTPESAANAMIAKASEINLKFVGRQRIYRQLRKQGKVSGHLEIFQFCDLDDAHNLIQLNPIFAAFMPCRIAMVEDKNGSVWLMTFNLDMVINSTMLTPAEGEIAIRVNQNMLKVLVAGATGKS
ncbi:MAG: DUF302 domain-containing protein [Gammaproteobacteria bacterium]|nr:DUF302 domain-containing protein [Gammaproteobacteria bacterium]